jgi:hypothetical protein
LDQQRQSNVSAPGPDAINPSEQLAAISLRVRKMVDDQYRLWNEDLVPLMDFSSADEGHNMATRQKAF